MDLSKQYYSGTSGLVLPVSNKLAYPPDYQDKTRLCFYSSLFNSLEVNSSFYKMPQAKTLAKWSAEVSDNFKFTFKLFQDISHAKELQYDRELIQKFVDVISAVGDKKGCLLVQFPPKFSYENVRELERLMTELALANAGMWSIAIEFRNKTWYNEEVFELLDQHNMGMVFHDMPSSASPMPDQNSDFIYLRFHGPQGGYRGSYPDEFLSEYALYIKDWIEHGKTVYVYFNNTMGAAVHNLITLNDYVNEEM